MHVSFFNWYQTSVLTKIWITSNSFFSRGVSLRAKGPIVYYVPRGGGGGGRWFWRGGTILKQVPFWGVNFSLVRNMRGSNFMTQQQQSGERIWRDFRSREKGCLIWSRKSLEPGTQGFSFVCGAGYRQFVLDLFTVFQSVYMKKKDRKCQSTKPGM